MGSEFGPLWALADKEAPFVDMVFKGFEDQVVDDEDEADWDGESGADRSE
jgi:hypothetical protein